MVEIDEKSENQQNNQTEKTYFACEKNKKSNIKCHKRVQKNMPEQILCVFITNRRILVECFFFHV